MRRIWNLLAVTVIACTVGGCSNTNDNAPQLDATGKHPANWPVEHRAVYLAAPDQCAGCHGTDLHGGIAKVGCFAVGFGGLNCHGHPAGFRDPAAHGVAAKGTPGLTTGIDHCRNCHGDGFAGGVLTTISCLNNAACHGPNNAPHPSKPWRGVRNHNSTNTLNAAACARCHAGGANLASLPKPPPQPGGTSPGCFNNTLCHGLVGHPDGWRDPAQHGATAKLTPGSASGFIYCQNCHGADFRGGLANRSCFTASTATGACHVRAGVPVNAPHAPAPWRGGASASIHTDTDMKNAQNPDGVCAGCHLNGANSQRQPNPQAPAGTPPDCFNNTLCHGVVGHPLGWASPSQHGATGKANLTFCQQCHAQPAGAGPGSSPRFNVQLGRLVDGANTGCEVCHKVNAAHPPALQIPVFFTMTGTLNRPWFRHKTAGSFDTACVLCHGANFEGGVGPACAKCHRSGLPLQVQNCLSCHGTPPEGTVYPNREFAHTRHTSLVGLSCAVNTCHNGFGSNTLGHFLKAKQQPTQLPADVAFITPFPYNARGSAASFASTINGIQCASISCHGGITTPPWRTGVINVNTDCTTCHAFRTTEPDRQFNSFNSGPKRHHLDVLGAQCPLCHNTAKLAVNHFTTLGTPAMEGPAAATIGGGTSSVKSYDPVSRSCSLNAGAVAACHGDGRLWNPLFTPP